VFLVGISTIRKVLVKGALMYKTQITTPLIVTFQNFNLIFIETKDVSNFKFLNKLKPTAKYLTAEVN
jgi:hypothetical protein